MADSTATDVAPPASNSHSTTDIQAKLTRLKASATRQYALKNYTAAAEFYSEAAELQDQVNGEMSPDNADLLYQYGRCLYHLGVSKSDVLGGKVAQEEQKPKKKKRKVGDAKAGGSSAGGAGEGAASNALDTVDEKMAEDAVEAVVEKKEGENKAEKDELSSKPFFQITGDENWTDSEDEDDEEVDVEGEGDEEEDDDFAIAYEILDVARVLLRRKFEHLQAQSEATDGKAPASKESPEIRQLKERLADTHDLQAEIKLENEQFADAVSDARDSLTLKLELFPQESGIVAEAHFKLAIALDFASLPTTSTNAETADGESAPPPPEKKEEPKVDETLRAEAAAQMENAIASCQLRMQKETAALPDITELTKKEAAKRSIADIKSMVSEMKTRLVDLQGPVQNSNTLASTGASLGDEEAMKGLLGGLLGESKADREKRIKEATEGANDLTGLVKKKKVKVEEKKEEVGAGKGKKRAAEGEDATGGGKKVKFEDAA